MSDRTTTTATPKTLVEGQRLDQPTFHAIYESPAHAAFVERLAGGRERS